MSTAHTVDTRMTSRPSGVAPFDDREFRNVLGRFPTGVAIVTTKSEAVGLVGLTINSFASVSLNPALVLWSLAKKSNSLEVFEKSDSFAIHILSEKEMDLAVRFASKTDDRFSGLDVKEGVTGAPLIQQCAARLECVVSSVIDGGDHRIFIGNVVGIDESDALAPPLVFHRGNFAKLQ